MESENVGVLEINNQEYDLSSLTKICFLSIGDPSCTNTGYDKYDLYQWCLTEEKRVNENIDEEIYTILCFN